MNLGDRVLLLGLALTLWLLAAPPAAAHGVLERSNPRANTSLDASPRQVILWFTEPVDSGLSSVAVLDRQGKRAGQRAVVSQDGRQMTVAVGELSRGVYTVRWRVLSTVDGHTTAGAFAFAIGEAAPSAPGDAGVARPGTGRVAIRWAGFLAAILLAGSTFFQVGVLRPALARVDPQDAHRITDVAAGRLRPLAVVAIPVLLVSVMVEFALQATALLDASLSQVITGGMLWSLLGGTRVGWSLLARVTMALVLLFPLLPLGRIPKAAASIPDRRILQPGWVSLLAGAGLLAGFTITAHASGSGALAALVDWVHLLAVALWIGGLVTLLLVLRAAAPSDRSWLSAALVPRFSTVAGISLVVVIATGLYSSWLNLPSARALTITPYGRALLVKLVLIAPLVALGALNRFVLRPRLAVATAGSEPAALRRFLHFVTGEVGLGAVILLVVAVLTITPPAKVTMPVTAPKPLILAGLAGDVQVRLTVTPALPGWNRLEVVAIGPDGRPIAADGRVFLRLTKLDENLNPTTVPLIPQGDGQHVAEGGDVGLPGWWEVEVVVRQRGSLDVSTSFPLRLGQPSISPPNPSAVRLLEGAEQAMARVTTWRQVEQITDGSGGVAFTSFELVRPDRLRLRASGGPETVIIGTTQYQRTGTGPWERTTLQRAFSVESPLLGTGRAEAVLQGRQASCDVEACRVILWEAPGRTAAFAGWIGGDSRRLHRLMMIAPSHYMTGRLTDFNARLTITPPK
ncbi:MAG: copper resistance CopC/CopD family protein [Armatimonadota bacterium]